jgi:hypothetical protein
MQSEKTIKATKTIKARKNHQGPPDPVGQTPAESEFISYFPVRVSGTEANTLPGILAASASSQQFDSALAPARYVCR